jgi:hypothetical protein
MSLILDGTNGLSDIDGSAATPAIRGTDANTGIFFPAADTIAFSEGGAEAARIDSSANLLVGATSGGGLNERLSVTGNGILVQSAASTNRGLFGNFGGSNLIIGSFDSIPIEFRTNNTERARIPSTGGIQSVNSISVGNATPSASGAGITFPATQSASSDANTLDDYEEGTFTPIIVGSSTAGTASYSTQIGRYTRIGRMVQFECAVEYSSGTGTGNLRVSGLPFTCQGNSFPPTTCNLDSITLSANNYASPYVQSGDTYILMSQNPTGGGSRTAIAYDAAGGILVAGTYST